MSKITNKYYKDFIEFVNILEPSLINLFNEFLSRDDPQPGDKYVFINRHMSIENPIYSFNIIFDKVIFDDTFNNGVAFYYIFHREDNGEELNVHSINDVNDPSILNQDEYEDLFRFWKDCIPVE